MSKTATIHVRSWQHNTCNFLGCMIWKTEKVIPLNNCGNILPFGVGNVAGGEREGEILGLGVRGRGRFLGLGVRGRGRFLGLGVRGRGRFLGLGVRGRGRFLGLGVRGRERCPVRKEKKNDYMPLIVNKTIALFEMYMYLTFSD